MNRTSAYLDLPEARIYYERQGQGPLVLLIPGGAQDAGVFHPLADRLAEQYTVATLDPRGNSRSAFLGAPTTLDLDRHGEDAFAVIEACGGGRAYVFGTSGGAHVALSLCERFPDAVAGLVAHEPPSVMLLPDPTPAIAEEKRIHEIYRSEGIEAAMAAFFAENNFGDSEQGGPSEEQPAMPAAGETIERVCQNLTYWLGHGMLSLSLYRPNVEALRRGDPPIRVAIGQGSKGQPIEAMSEALAGALGIKPMRVPGDHIGFMRYPDQFAAILDQSFKACAVGASEMAE